MNKRILSVILTLIMLVSLVPAGAITASAAGASISESAITVLKQLEGYSKYCVKGYTGYGTLCTKSGDHSAHVTTEKEADTALRAELKELDAAVNSFASKNGLALSQNKHDALVMFSFENGTAWTTGTGDFQTAVKSGASGSKFLNAICWWDNDTADDDRRMIEANMYLNGVYSSSVPSRFIRVQYKVNGGTMPEAEYQYYDTNENPTPDIVPTRQGYIFLGWFADEVNSYRVTSLSKSRTLYAYWQEEGDEPTVHGTRFTETNVSYYTSVSNSTRLYQYDRRDIIAEDEEDTDQKVKVYSSAIATTTDVSIDRGTEVSIVSSTAVAGRIQITYNTDKTGWVREENVVEDRIFEKTDMTVKGTLKIVREYIDGNNIRWGLVYSAQKVYEDGEKVAEDETNGVVLHSEYWINLGEVSYNDGLTGGSTAPSYSMDVVVTVTNTYLRIRSQANASSTELGKLYMGEQVRIVNTASSNGSLWGQIADEDGDGVCDGWIALVYTNYESVKGNSNPVTSYNVVATATVVAPVNGYVNVRSGAGTDNQIVGSLSYQSRVDLYEITYVNGIQWGRYSGGWFCLSYADVNGIDLNDYAGNANVLAYAFTGSLKTGAKDNVYVAAGSTEKVDLKSTFISSNRTISNLTEVNGVTWGKITEGWVKVTNADGTPADVELKVAKYYTVVDGVTVRDVDLSVERPSANAPRITNLVKGVEFNVNETYQVMVVGETIWGYADKVGENTPTYGGWINLASKYVARGDAPSAEANDDDGYTGLIGTIVGADKVNVRIHHATYSKVLGKIARGTTVKILGEEDGWYKIDYDVDGDPDTDSWVVNTYVEVTKASSGTGTGSTGTSSGTGTVETGLGIVANTYTGVNVRTAPGTGNPAVGKLLAGSTVEILEVTTYGASKWGRVSQGWICMDYVTMVTNYEILGALTGNNGNAGSSSSTSEVAIYTGKTLNTVEIFKTTSEDADVVRTVEAGTNITMHEIVTVTETEVSDPTYNGNSSTTTTITTTYYWARVNDGYIKDPALNIALDPEDEATYTVTGYETLNVRTTAGTDGAVEYRLQKGDQVTVTKLAIINGTVWGFVEGETVKRVAVDEEGETYEEIEWKGDGWISLAYCTKGAITIQTESNNNNTNTTTPTTPPLGVGSSTGGYVTNTSGYRYTGKVINTNSVNVRATASTAAAVTTTLSSGAALVIYETTISENMAWGRCDAGWVYLYYVDLTPVVGGAVDARVVYNENTIAYTDMNCSSVAGTYSKMSVVDIYEIVGKMARTELGWVNTDNLL